jgi:bleomycin hydrolase
MRFLLIIFLSVACFSLSGKERGYSFSKSKTYGLSGLQLIKEVPSTPVKDQFETGTCWSFSGLSFIESELIRQGKGIYDLSELFVVRYSYIRKAERYIRMHGKVNFPIGGEANDVSQIIDIFGIVPEDIYPGYAKNPALREDEEMDKELKAYVDSIVRTYENKLDPDWKDGYLSILNKYMGPLPDQFIYNNEVYSAISFARSLGISSGNYQLITSFINYPFYKPFILEVPDNWSWEESMNVPLDELVDILDTALYKGFSVAWALDISEKGFCFRKGMAYLPEKVYQTDTIVSTDSAMNTLKSGINFDFNHPEKEISVNEEIRQNAFDNFATTDDHLMHIVGSAISADGQKYYYVKNSWGPDNQFNGYIFVSEAYFRYKTISIMVNKDAVPSAIALKFNL